MVDYDFRYQYQYKLRPMEVEDSSKSTGEMFHMWMLTDQGKNWEVELDLDWDFFQRHYEHTRKYPSSYKVTPYQRIFTGNPYHFHVTFSKEIWDGKHGDMESQMDRVLGHIIGTLRRQIRPPGHENQYAIMNPKYIEMMKDPESCARVYELLRNGFCNFLPVATAEDDGFLNYFCLDYTISIDRSLFHTEKPKKKHIKVKSHVAVGMVNEKLMVHFHFIETEPKKVTFYTGSGTMQLKKLLKEMDEDM